MTDELLAEQKAHLDELIQTAEKAIAEEKSDEYENQSQILSKAIQVAKAAMTLKDSYYPAKEVYDGRDPGRRLGKLY